MAGTGSARFLYASPAVAGANACTGHSRTARLAALSKVFWGLRMGIGMFAALPGDLTSLLAESSLKNDGTPPLVSPGQLPQKKRCSKDGVMESVPQDL